MPGLGRIPNFDERSRAFPMRALLPRATEVARVNKIWRRPTAFDQADTPQCVGYSTYGLVNSQPNTALIPLATRRSLTPTQIYQEAQRIDPWPGESYDGTSVLAGMQFAHSAGLIPVYRWCFGLDDVLDTLSLYGPVVIGVTWLNSMFHQPNPHPDRYNKVPLNVDWATRSAGGHAIEIHGINITKQLVIGTNSWSTGWGDEGRFYLTFQDLNDLLNDDGEAVAATAS